MTAENFTWRPLIQHSSSCSEVSLCSLVLDSLTKDLLGTILACIINIIIRLVSLNRL